MTPAAYIFPGQGSQFVGMGKDLVESHPAARETFEEADEILRFRLSAVCFDGPADQLTRTEVTQPAIFVHSIAVGRLIGFPPAAAVAGHSLGEYSALVYAGALSFGEGLRLVRTRGELMQMACDAAGGTMAAVVGLEPDVVESICVEASAAGIVVCANFNSPGQIVISGSVDGVKRAMVVAKERGAKLVKELTVAGAFHSPLMEPARTKFAEALRTVRLSDPNTPLYPNVTGKAEQKGEKIRTLLGAQLTSAVRWESSVRNMIASGVRTFVELGPGKVLQGLIKRIDPSVETFGIGTSVEVGELVERTARASRASGAGVAS